MSNGRVNNVIHGDCLAWFERPKLEETKQFSLTFLDPPFNQGKAYRVHDDRMVDSEYWNWMKLVCQRTYQNTEDGGSIYFMQREKNVAEVVNTLTESGWTFQNLIIWKKKSSAVPSLSRYGKSFQVIVFATKGKRVKTFNRLRIDPRLPAGYKPRKNGVFVTDIWDDIRELTSGYFAGDEVLRMKSGERSHLQQSPTSLLLRIILSSSSPGMHIFDPFAGTGTTGVVAKQLGRSYTMIERDIENFKLINSRLQVPRKSDDISKYRTDYLHTAELNQIWPEKTEAIDASELFPKKGATPKAADAVQIEAR